MPIKLKNNLAKKSQTLNIPNKSKIKQPKKAKN